MAMLNNQKVRWWGWRVFFFLHPVDIWQLEVLGWLSKASQNFWEVTPAIVWWDAMVSGTTNHCDPVSKKLKLCRAILTNTDKEIVSFWRKSTLTFVRGWMAWSTWQYLPSMFLTVILCNWCMFPFISIHVYNSSYIFLGVKDKVNRKNGAFRAVLRPQANQLLLALLGMTWMVFPLLSNQQPTKSSVEQAGGGDPAMSTMVYPLVN